MRGEFAQTSALFGGELRRGARLRHDPRSVQRAVTFGDQVARAQQWRAALTGFTMHENALSAANGGAQKRHTLRQLFERHGASIGCRQPQISVDFFVVSERVLLLLLQIDNRGNASIAQRGPVVRAEFAAE